MQNKQKTSSVKKNTMSQSLTWKICICMSNRYSLVHPRCQSPPLWDLGGSCVPQTGGPRRATRRTSRWYSKWWDSGTDVVEIEISLQWDWEKVYIHSHKSYMSDMYSGTSLIQGRRKYMSWLVKCPGREVHIWGSRSALPIQVSLKFSWLEIPLHM